MPPKINIKKLINKLHEAHDRTSETNREFHLQRSFKSPVVEGIAKWQPILPEEILEMKLGDFLCQRYLFEFKHGKHRYFVCTHAKDYDAIKMKYPEGVVINLKDVIGLWTGNFRAEETGGFADRMAGPILNLMRIIPGTKIVGVENYIDS